MIVKPFRRFISRFFNFAFFHIISGSTFGTAAAVGHRGELFHCPSEGFHPDLTDCKIFYRCVDWNVNSFGEPSATSLTAFQFACAEGTVFDPDLNVCNHPRDTSRAECGGTRVPLRSGYPVLQFPPQENAGGYFGGGVSFPPANETAHGAGHFQSRNAYANEYPYRRGDNSKYPWQLDEYQNPAAGPAKDSGSCQSEGFFPVDGDCSKFTRCVVDGTGRYRMYTFQCGPGTVWDQRNLVCNYPYAVPGCGCTQGCNGQGLMSHESDYDSAWRQPVRENNGYTGMPLEGAYPGVENQEGRPPVRSYSEMGNYPYHGDHMTYPQKGPQTYGSESARPEWNANNFQPANYPAMNPDQVHNGNIPYHTTYSEAQFQGKYSQAEYYFTGENFDPYPAQNEYQYRPVSSTHMSYAVTDNETSQAGFPKRPDQSPYSEPGGQSYYPSQGSYPGNYQNRPETSTTAQTYQTKQNEETQIPFANNPYRPPGQQTEGYGGQMYEGDSYSPQLKEPAEEPGIPEVPSGDSKECHKDGFFSIPGECKKFFRCVDNGKGGYFRYDFNCGEGTVWDQGSTTCNHPWAVKRGDVDCSAEGSPPQTEPNSFYATPTHQTQPQSSGAWSQSSQTATTHAASSYATASSTAGREKAPQSQKPETTWSGGYDQYKSTTVKHKTSSQTTSGKETTFQKGKDKPGATTPMTPNKYTMTDNKRTSEMHYDDKNVRDSTPTPQGEHGETSTSPPESTPFQPSDKGRIRCEKAGFYPYPGSCTKFYRCADWDGDKGERFSVYYFECAPGTIWDPALNTCNHEDSVYPPRSCGVEESTEEKRPPTTEESTEEKRPPTTEESTEEKRPPTTEESTEEKQPPPTTEESTSAGNESTEVTGTGDYTEITTSSSSDDRTSGEVTTSGDSDTTTTTTSYTSEESSPTTNAEGSTLASTDSTDGETTTVSSTEEEGSTTATTDSAMTTTRDESTAPSTTAMTTTEQYETLYTSGNQTETASMSTRVETLFTSVPTTETASDFPTTAESEPADAGEEGNATTQSPGDQNPSPGDSSPDCPALGDDQVLFVCPTGFRRHPRECNNFYQCTVSREGDVNIMILTCQNRTVYDERKIQCLPEDETESCPGKASGKSRQYRRTERETISTVPVSPSQSLCPQQGNFPYHGDCRKFFKCRTDRKGRMEGFLYQCPENFSFWEASGRCEPTDQLPKCSRFPQDVSSGKLKWMSSKVPVASPGSEVR